MVKLAKGNIIAKENPKKLSYPEELEQKLTGLFSKYRDPLGLFLHAYFTTITSLDKSISSLEWSEQNGCWTIVKALQSIQNNETVTALEGSNNPDFYTDVTYSLRKGMSFLFDNKDRDALKFLIDLDEIFNEIICEEGGEE